MQFFIILQIILTFVYVAYLIMQYSLSTISLQVKILVYFTWLLCFIIVVLLPYDVYYSLHQDDGMSITWKLIYYLIFLLTWVLLPIAQQYQTSGEFTVKEKLKTAIINNLIIYGVFLIIGALFLIYLWAKSSLSIQELMPILMAASNVFGMSLVVIFLSYGLVAIPKQLWRQRQYQIKLKYKQFTAAKINKKKENTIQELQLKVKQILWQKQKNGQNPQITHVLNLIPKDLLQKWRKNVPNLGKVNVVKLHQEIKQLLLQYNRLESRWDNLLHQAFLIQDIILNMNSNSHKIESTLFPVYKYDFFNYIIWFWHCRIKLILIPSLAVIFSLFALSIIIAQLSAFLPAASFLNPFGKLTEISTFFMMDCSLLIVFSYIVFCVYYALFKLKFASFYGLYWNKQTDAASLIFYAINCSRVSTPLGYNFLQIINDNKTSFINVMGQANVVPVFGQTFSIIFPVLLIILIVFNAFDVYSKIAKRFGLQKFEFENQFDHQNIDQGRRLLQKARTQVQTKILNSNDKDLNNFKSYKSQLGTNSQISTNKESTSSDAIKIQNKQFFNKFQNMEDFAKIMNM